MKKIYIAGKVTGLPQAEVVAKFEEAQLNFEKLGFEVVNPVEVVGTFDTTWQDAMRLCIKAMMNCNEMVLLPCWTHSKGALVERTLAESLGMNITFYDSIDFDFVEYGKKSSYGEKLTTKLQNMLLNETFDKKKFIAKHWGIVDEYTIRSFDVILCNAKKQIANKSFRTAGGIVTRTK